MNNVEFRCGSQAKYNNLETKDDNTLYFTSDTKRIYKGDDLYADGNTSLDNVLHAYELSEDEFWNKYNSGELFDGLYWYEYPTLELSDFSNQVPFNYYFPILETEDKCYIASYYPGNSNNAFHLSVINRDGDLLGDYNFYSMMNNTTIQILRAYPEISKSFIGMDDFGYLYVGAADVSSSSSIYHYGGVIAINTNDIDNPDSWNWVEGLSNVAFTSFSTFNPCFNGSDGLVIPFLSNPKYLKVKDGGIFGSSIGGISPEHYSTAYSIAHDNYVSILDSIWFHQVYYLKEGKLVFRNHLLHTGPQSLDVDYENNKLYVAEDIVIPYNNKSHVCIKSISIDGTTIEYPIFVSDHLSPDYGYMDSNANVASQILRFINNKVFLYVNRNRYSWILTLDPERGQYTNTLCLDGNYNTFNTHNGNSPCYISNVYDTGNSISYLLTLYDLNYNKTSILINWNYRTDKVNVKYLYDYLLKYNYINIRNDKNGNIILLTKENEDVYVYSIYPDDGLNVKYKIKISDDRYHSNDYATMDSIYNTKSDRGIIVCDYVWSYISSKAKYRNIIIDDDGNIEIENTISGQDLNIVEQIDVNNEFSILVDPRYMHQLYYDYFDKYIGTHNFDYLGLSSDYCLIMILGKPIFAYGLGLDTRMRSFTVSVSKKKRKQQMFTFKNKILSHSSSDVSEDD